MNSSWVIVSNSTWDVLAVRFATPQGVSIVYGFWGGSEIVCNIESAQIQAPETIQESLDQIRNLTEYDYERAKKSQFEALCRFAGTDEDASEFEQVLSRHRINATLEIKILLVLSLIHRVAIHWKIIEEASEATPLRVFVQALNESLSASDSVQNAAAKLLNACGSFGSQAEELSLYSRLDSVKQLQILVQLIAAGESYPLWLLSLCAKLFARTKIVRVIASKSEERSSELFKALEMGLQQLDSGHLKRAQQRFVELGQELFPDYFTAG